MCKIMVMAGINDEMRPKAIEFVRKMAEKMSYTPNNDGLGYSAIDSDGNLFGERWHSNFQAFKFRDPVTKFDMEIFKKTKGMLKKKRNAYNSFGVLNEKKMTAITLHTRYATSGKEFCNTHPFVDGDTSLIHNGVIKNTKELDNFTSTCDSECILNKYVEKDVNNKIGEIQKVAEALDGYYACAVLSKTSEGVPILDVFKDAGATLNAAVIKEFGNVVVFSTDLKDIESVCDDLKLTIEHRYECDYGILVRMNAITGEAIDSVEFKAEYGKKERAADEEYEQWWQRGAGCKHSESDDRMAETEDFRELCKGLENMSDWYRNSKTNVWYKKK